MRSRRGRGPARVPGWSRPRPPSDRGSSSASRTRSRPTRGLRPGREHRHRQAARLARSLDIPRAVANFRFFATAILHTDSDLYRTDDRALNYTLRQPRGVAGLISPWNLPLYLFTWKIAPALATGNTVVAKPSELTPLTAAHADRAVRRGRAAAGRAQRRPRPGRARRARRSWHHPDVPTISFTGGTATGREIARTAGPAVQEAGPGAGRQEPELVFADADLDEAMPGIVPLARSRTRARSACAARASSSRSALYDRFVGGFVADAVGRSGSATRWTQATDQGALISAAHRDKVMSYIDLARGGGRRDRCPAAGRPSRPDGALPRTATSSSRRSITGLPVDCRVNKEEIFGPVVTITPFAGRGRGGRVGQRHAATACRPRCGRTTWRRPTASPSSSMPARSGSTAGCCATCACRSAA